MTLNLYRVVQDWRQFIIGILYCLATIAIISKILTVLQVAIFPLINRVTYFGFEFNGGLIGIDAADSLLALSAVSAVIALSVHRSAAISVVAIATAIAAAFYSLGNPDVIFYSALAAWIAFTVIDNIPSLRMRLNLQNRNMPKRLEGIFVFLVAFEGLALARWIAHPFFHTAPFEGAFWQIAFIDFQLYYFLALAAPAMMLVMVAGLVVRYNLARYLPKSFIAIGETSPSLISWSRKKYLAIISALFVLAVILPLYPYSESLNPDGIMLGTDDYLYYEWVSEMISSGEPLRSAFIEIRGGDRPLTLLIIYGLTLLTNLDLQTVISFLPVLLTPLLLLTTLFFVGQLTKDRILSIVAGFFSITSFQVAVGIYAGFHANWFALCPAILSFAFTVLYYKNHKRVYLGLIFACMIATLLFHVYTWVFAISALFLFVAISVFKKRSDFRILLPVLLVVGLSVAVDLARSQIFSFTGGISEDANIVVNYTGTDQFTARWNNVTYLSRAFLGGFFGNVVILGLATLWLLRADLSNSFDRMLYSATAPLFVPMLLSDYGVQSRILYDAPLFMLASIIIAGLIKRREKHYLLLALLVLLFQANYIVRAMANLFPQFSS